MQLSQITASIAVVLAIGLTAGYAVGEEPEPPAPQKTVQKQIEEREAQRRAALAEHQQRKEAFQRRCIKPVKTEAELEACRLAYRQL
jgi:hypothetical protein